MNCPMCQYEIDHADKFMGNCDASELGEIALKAGSPKRKDVGDSIDRGLILRRLLEESGYYLIKK